jgi:tellurite resistance protein TerC
VAEAAPIWLWITFGAALLILLAIDLVSHRITGETRRSALWWSVVWIASGLTFNGVVWLTMGADAGQEYLAAFLIEKSLSVDNLFVFLVILGGLEMTPSNQRKVLTWGVLGAIVLRAIFIFAGISALERYEWLNWVFASILVIAAIRSLRDKPASNSRGVVTFLEKHLRITNSSRSGKFFVRKEGKLYATRMLVAILAVELTDIMFAIDSVPAALSVSHNRFIVLSSNAFAILGLRALYMLLATLLPQMKYLHYGLAFILAFAGFKIAAEPWLHISAWLSIGLIVLALSTTVGASLMSRRKARSAAGRPPPGSDSSPAGA